MRPAILAVACVALLGCAAAERGVRFPVVAGAVPTEMPRYREEIRGLVAELSECGVVDEAVGISGAPGTYPLLRARLERIVTPEDCRRMAMDPRVIVRVMGMELIAMRHREAVKLILPRLRSPIRLPHQCGCVPGYVEEGDYAFDALVRWKTLAEGEEVALALMKLTWDETRTSETYGGWHLRERLIDGALPFDLAALRILARGMPDAQIIKSIGRLELPHEEIYDGLEKVTDDSDLQARREIEGKRFQTLLAKKRRAFLGACLRDTALPLEARLAAGSALTRDPTMEASTILVRNEKWLDQATGARKAGSRFVAEWMERLTCERLRMPARNWWKDRPESEWVEVSDHSHPMFIEYLASSRGPAADAAWESLVALAKKLGDYREPWDTYSDAPYKLAHIVAEDMNNKASVKEGGGLFGAATNPAQQEWESKRQRQVAAIAREVKKWVPEYELIVTDPNEDK